MAIIVRISTQVSRNHCLNVGGWFKSWVLSLRPCFPFDVVNFDFHPRRFREVVGVVAVTGAGRVALWSVEWRGAVVAST